MARAYSTVRFLAQFLKERSTAHLTPTLPQLHLRATKDVCRLNAFRTAFHDVSTCITVSNPSLPLLANKLTRVSKPAGVCDMMVVKHLDASQLPLLPSLSQHASLVVLLDSVTLRSGNQAPLLQLCPPATTVHCMFRDMLYDPSGRLRYRHIYRIARLNTVMQLNNLVSSITTNLETWTLSPKSLTSTWRIQIDHVNVSLLWTLFLMLQPMKAQVHYSVSLGPGDEPSCVFEYEFKS